MRFMTRFVPPVTSHTPSLGQMSFPYSNHHHEHHDQKSHLVLFRDFALGAGEDSDHSSVTIPEVIMVTMMIILMTMIIMKNVNMMTLMTKKEKIAYLAAVWKGVSPYWGENIMRTALQLSLFFC